MLSGDEAGVEVTVPVVLAGGLVQEDKTSIATAKRHTFSDT
jgi:hypothetical protein